MMFSADGGSMSPAMPEGPHDGVAAGPDGVAGEPESFAELQGVQPATGVIGEVTGMVHATGIGVVVGGPSGMRLVPDAAVTDLGSVGCVGVELREQDCQGMC